MVTVFTCRDDVDSILSGVYDAWMSRLGHANVRLELEYGDSRDLFCQYREVQTDPGKAAKVVEAIRGRICEEAWESVYQAALCGDAGKADWIYRFLVTGFACGRRVMDALSCPEVFAIFEMARRVQHEAHRLTGFVRFFQAGEGALVSRVSPKQDVLALLARHFADRLPQEDWMIYDELREKAAIHPSGRAWSLMQVDASQWEGRLVQSDEEAVYEALWKVFHRHISIRERENPKCQMGMLPLRFRPHMTEFRP